jgi:hypothetical protein
VKFVVALLAPLIVTPRLAGVNTAVGLLGVTTYDPFGTPVRLKLPDESAMEEAAITPVDDEVSVTVDPPPTPNEDNVIFPEIE